MTDNDFDPDLLQRVDRPYTPPPAAAERIRTSMLKEYTAEVENRAPHRTSDPALLIDFEEQQHRTRRPDKTQYRVLLVAIAAAAILIVGYAVRQLPSDLQDPLADTTEQWCRNKLNIAIPDVVVFHQDPGGERTAGALRRFEQLSQELADLASDYRDELDVDLSTELEALPAAAADARLATTSAEANGDQAVADLAQQTADAVDQLPSSESCEIDSLRGLDN